MCKCDTHAHGIISAKQTVTIAACCFRAAAEAWVRGRISAKRNVTIAVCCFRAAAEAWVRGRWSRRRRWGPGRRRLRWGGSSFIVKKPCPTVV